MTETSQTNQQEYKLIEIGNPTKLNEDCDPFHRVTNKLKTFMTYIDLIPTDWNLNLANVLQDQQAAKDSRTNGVASYNLIEATKKYKDRCIKYGLEQYSGIRILTNAESIYQEGFENNFANNNISSTLNQATNLTQGIRDIFKSSGLDPNKKMEDMFNKMAANGSETANVLKEISQGGGGNVLEVAKQMLIKGRQIGLPKIYQGSTYTPAFQSSIKLVSPYGNPKAIKKHVLDPLIYFLLLTCPETTDGISYGGYSFLRAHAYGICNLPLAYITQIQVSRGGNESITNKHGQPLSVNISFNLSPALDGFACAIGDRMSTLQTEDMLNDMDIIKLSSDTAINTIDNIIESFKKFPGSDYYTNNGDFPNPLAGFASEVMGAVANVGSEISTIKSKVIGGISTTATGLLM